MASISNRGYSSMVEQSAHNGLGVGSNPTSPKSPRSSIGRALGL